MVITNKTTLPEEAELDVQELNLSSAALRAGSFHLGKQCEGVNNVSILQFWSNYYILKAMLKCMY